MVYDIIIMFECTFLILNFYSQCSHTKTQNITSCVIKILHWFSILKCHCFCVYCFIFILADYFTVISYLVVTDFFSKKITKIGVTTR